MDDRVQKALRAATARRRHKLAYYRQYKKTARGYLVNQLYGVRRRRRAKLAQIARLEGANA